MANDALCGSPSSGFSRPTAEAGRAFLSVASGSFRFAPVQIRPLYLYPARRRARDAAATADEARSAKRPRAMPAASLLLLAALLAVGSVHAQLGFSATATRRRVPPTMDAWFSWSTSLNTTATPVELCEFARVPRELVKTPGARGAGRDCRLWTQADLRRLRGATHYAGMLPLLRRLDAGLPITVAAFGSSIASNHAGCFHSDLGFLRSRIDNLPLNFHMNPDRTICAPESLWRVGFASLFMATVNRTWPHAGHLLVNVGMGATTLSSVTDHTCLDEHTPPDVDLLLFEQYQQESGAHTANERSGVEVEKLYRQLQARRDAFEAENAADGNAPIPVFLLNYMEIVSFPMNVCIIDWGRMCGTDTLCGFNFSHMASPVGNVLREEHLEVMANYYGWSSFSVRNLASSWLRDGAHTAAGLSECQFLATLFRDRIHSTPLLAWMMADALVQHLVDAAAWADVDGAPEHANVTHLPLRVPALPLFPEAAAPPPNRVCASAAELVVTNARNWVFYETEAVTEMGHVAAAPGSHVAAAKRQAAHKPGWISEAADAALDINLTAVSSVAAVAALGGSVSVNLMYLQSYSKMTVALFSCVGDCTCPPASLDGRCEERVSLHVSHQTRVVLFAAAAAGGASPACMLRLRVDASAVFGGHKFKVLGLSLSLTR
jgi:hypothetical protein